MICKILSDVLMGTLSHLKWIRNKKVMRFESKKDSKRKKINK